MAIHLITKDNFKDFIQKHDIPVVYPDGERITGGAEYRLPQCLFCGNSDSGKFIVWDNGTVVYKCHHNSCKGKRMADVLKKYEPDAFKDRKSIRVPSRTGKPQDILDAVQKLSEVEKEDIEWVIYGAIPKGAVSLLSGDGGAAKTATWTDLVAALTTGRRCLFDYGADNAPIPYLSKETQREMYRPPMKVLYFSGEDSTEAVLKQRLENAGADQDRIELISTKREELQAIYFGSEELEIIIEDRKPDIVVFDPIQSFLPPKVNMSQRNEMRQALAPLMTMGSKFGTAFLIISHTNKRQGVAGRVRIGDSSDLWDASRSVFIVGVTNEKNIRYLSHEKCNYGRQIQTVLFTVNDNACVEYCSTTDKRDADFQQQALNASRATPARDEAVDALMEILKDGDPHEVNEIAEIMGASGISKTALRKAKEHLKKDLKQIRSFQTGKGESRKEFLVLIEKQGERYDINNLSLDENID